MLRAAVSAPASTFLAPNARNAKPIPNKKSPRKYFTDAVLATAFAVLHASLLAFVTAVLIATILAVLPAVLFAIILAVFLDLVLAVCLAIRLAILLASLTFLYSC